MNRRRRRQQKWKATVRYWQHVIACCPREKVKVGVTVDMNGRAFGRFFPVHRLGVDIKNKGLPGWIDGITSRLDYRVRNGLIP